MTPKKYEPDVKDIFRLCDTHNIPLATNLATAELTHQIIRPRRSRVA